MKIWELFKYFLAAFGCAAIVMAVVLYLDTWSFLKEAVPGRGAVEQIHRQQVDGKTKCALVVRFQGNDGRPFEFLSRGAGCSTYRVGDELPILYSRAQPENARINRFFSLWGGSIIGGLIGPVFLLLGGAWILAGWRKQRQVATLKREGARVETELECVERLTSIKIQHRHPYRVVTRWRDPSTNAIHRFYSDYLRCDPTSYLEGTGEEARRVTVFMDRDDSRRYHMDLSFLPEPPR